MQLQYKTIMGLFNRKMNLSARLAKDAKRAGICDQWHDDLLKMDDKDAMVEMYLRGIDFCLSNDYPSNDFIRDNFKGIMERHGVFLDEAIDVVNFRKVVALGSTEGVVKYNGYSVGEVFAKHDAVLWVYAQDNAFVVVDVFDNAVVHVHADGRAKVCVNHYGGLVYNYADSAESVVKVREKHKKTY